MELQAMKTGLKPRDDEEIDRLLAARVPGVAGRFDVGSAGTGKVADKETFLAVQAIVDDFQGLRDVVSFAARATELSRDKSVRAALQKDRDEDRREETMLRDITSLEARLKSDDRQQTLTKLRQAWKDLSTQAKQPADSLERQLRETDRIADASRTMLDIAQENDAIAREFNATVQNLVASGKEFESEVARFRLSVK